MENILLLKKYGFVHHKKSGREVDDLLKYLGFTIELEEGFTLRDLFMMVGRYPDMDRIDPFMGSYLEEFYKCPESGCTTNDNMDVIRVQRCSQYTANNKYEDKDEFYINYNVDGRSTDPDEVDWALEFSPLNTLLDYPIILCDHSLELEDHNISVLALPENIKYYKTNYTLWELIHAIIWELSFCGTPDQRDGKKDELMKDLEDIESGKVKTIPWEEIRDKLLSDEED